MALRAAASQGYYIINHNQLGYSQQNPTEALWHQVNISPPAVGWEGGWGVGWGWKFALRGRLARAKWMDQLSDRREEGWEDGCNVTW